MSRICDCCGQPVHRHADRSARFSCPHCQQELCDLQVEPEPTEPGYYKHKDPFCPGLVEKR